MLSTTDALIAVVNGNPEDVIAATILLDAQMDSGVTPLAAKRRRNKVVKAAKAARLFTEVDAAVRVDTRKGARVRTAIRAAVGRGSNNSIPITVVEGDARPVLTGEDCYHTFKNGGICNHPGSARKYGYKIVYHASTLEITVGAGWVEANCLAKRGASV